MPSTSPFPVFIFDDLYERLRVLAEEKHMTVTDYAREKLSEITEPPPKEFEPLLSMFYQQVKDFAVACSELPSVPDGRREVAKHNLMTFLLEAVIGCKPGIVAELGLVQQLR